MHPIPMGPHRKGGFIEKYFILGHDNSLDHYLMVFNYNLNETNERRKGFYKMNTKYMDNLKIIVRMVEVQESLC
jgi:hypothetical protein